MRQFPRAVFFFEYILNIYFFFPTRAIDPYSRIISRNFYCDKVKIIIESNSIT